ncbi:unnamed protein product [Rhodiola kirilowii]
MGPQQSQAPTHRNTQDQSISDILASLVENQAKADQRMDQMFKKMDEMSTHNKMLENQIAQQASSSARYPGKLPSKPDFHQDEHVNAITLRSGKDYEPPQPKPKAPKPQIEVEIEEDKGENEQGVEKATEPVVEASTQPTKELPPYKPPVPFPQRLLKKKDDQHFNRFVEMLCKVNITLPFTEVLTQIPSYAKFLKDTVSHRRDISEHDMVALNLGCSAIIQNPLPKKLKDPGSFSIPIMIGDICIEDALYDLGASISLMPYSLCSKLDMGTLTPTSISLRLADRSSRVPKGILQDVPIKVGNFYIPVDFFVLEMEEEKETPIILGRPFLATAGAVIDVRQGSLVLNISNEKIEFNLAKACRSPSFSMDCNFIDVYDVFDYDALIHDTLEIFDDDNCEPCPHSLKIFVLLRKKKVKPPKVRNLVR